MVMVMVTYSALVRSHQSTSLVASASCVPRGYNTRAQPSLPLLELVRYSLVRAAMPLSMAGPCRIWLSTEPLSGHARPNGIRRGPRTRMSVNSHQRTTCHRHRPVQY